MTDVETLIAREREYTDWTFEADTVPQGFFVAAERFPDRPAQLYKGGTSPRSLSGAVLEEAPPGEYATLTYREVAGVVRNLAAGFRELGVEPDDRIGIYADTRMEWCHADLALQSAGAVVTTVYTESSPEQVEYLLSNPGATGVVVEDGALLDTLLSVGDHLDLDFVVVMDEYDGFDDRDDVHTLADVHSLGEAAFDRDEFDGWLESRQPDDLASIVYTSGTTGEPKGVMLTHGNFVSALNQSRKRLGPRPDKPADVPVVDEDAVFLSFLPLAHALERFNHFGYLGTGAAIAYAESPDTVGDDLELVRPTHVAGVPRVWEQVYDAIRTEASESPVKRRIFEWAVDVGLQYDEATNGEGDGPGPILSAKFGLADRLVFSQVREALGGNVELLTSGGGTLSADLARLYRAMGLIILEGYGLTETAPLVSLDFPEDIRIGTLGYPAVDVEVRVDHDVVGPEQREAEVGDVGELLVRGPNVTSGYWEKPEATERAFTEDVPASGASGGTGEAGSPGRWFRTGDVVAIDDDGFLRFVDRVKNILVLDTGKNVAPEPIEDAFATSERVDQVMVVGEDEKFVGAIVVPNFEELRAWADAEGLDLPDDPEAVCEDERVRSWVGEEIERVNEPLATHETIKAFRLVPEEWTADNDLLTPSMKKRRHNIREAYGDLIAEIYEDAERREAPSPA